MMWLYVLVVTRAILVSGQPCPVDIPDNERRDCYNWDFATETKCLERGCEWCPAQVSGPTCYFNDKVCPSEIAEGDRVDCLPEGGGRDACLAKDCVWCETTSGAVPDCFADPDSSLGGDVCPPDIPNNERIDCSPNAPPGALPQLCLQRGCYYCEGAENAEPWCFATKHIGYRMVGSEQVTPEGYRVNLERINTPSWFGHDIQQLTLDVEFHTDQRLRLKFYDAANARFEVPVTITAPGPKPSNPDYDVVFESNPFAIKVSRVSTGAVIFDSSIGGFQFADQFIQIATRLDSDRVYGFGEHEHHSFKQDMNWIKWGMYSRDLAVSSNNLYGVQPFYMNLEQSNNAHGVLFLNANAQDVVLQPAPALTYRTIGGILDIYIFMGPTPDNVVQQYNEAVGNPVMPPYWSLGFQLCRWGYQNLGEMQAAVGRMRQYDIPHDVQYGDIDYMDGKKIFTLDTVNFGGLPAYVDQLKQEGTRFIIILDPAVAIESFNSPGEYPPLDNAHALNVWIKDPAGQMPQEGEVWPGPVWYPDFFKDDTQTWWTDECINFHSVLDYAGLWIDMNEPSNFIHGTPTGCNRNRWNEPPFLPSIADSMYEKTLCADTQTVIGTSYNAHSLYGFSMANHSANAAHAVFPGLRSIVYSRSTFPGSGKWAQHWLGDNWSNWSNLRNSIIGLFEFNMFGMPYVGADICGFLDDTTEELCRRWQQLGAFYTFSRNHNSEGATQEQDPGKWPTVASDARKALHIRYRLLPYLYTLFHRAHTAGSTVIRPLMFEFPDDVNTHDISFQLMWGSAFLISPVLDAGVTSVNAYIPDARWFDYYTGTELGSRGAFTDLAAPIDHINIHLRGGYILPVQQPANSTMWSRSNPMGLIVILDDSGAADGELFWDDGETLDTHISGVYFEGSYSAAAGTLTASVVNDGYPGVSSLVMDDFVILGAGTVTTVTINGGSHGDWDQDPVTQQVTIRNAGVAVNSAFTVAWS